MVGGRGWAEGQRRGGGAGGGGASSSKGSPGGHLDAMSPQCSGLKLLSLHAAVPPLLPTGGGASGDSPGARSARSGQEGPAPAPRAQISTTPAVPPGRGGGHSGLRAPVVPSPLHPAGRGGGVGIRCTASRVAHTPPPSAALPSAPDPAPGDPRDPRSLTQYAESGFRPPFPSPHSSVPALHASPPSATHLGSPRTARRRHGSGLPAARPRRREATAGTTSPRRRRLELCSARAEVWVLAERGGGAWRGGRAPGSAPDPGKWGRGLGE